MVPLPGYYWPEGSRRDRDLDSLKAAFGTIGYDLCDNGNLEEGYEKVAIYVDKTGRWSHASRQESNGEWCSKLGNEEDIRHETPHCFGGSIYGEVAYFMKRVIVRSQSP